MSRTLIRRDDREPTHPKRLRILAVANSNASEVLDQLSTARPRAARGPDAIIVDAADMEPRVARFVARLRRFESTWHLPIVVVTEGTAASLVVTWLDAGATDCLPRSVSSAELAARVRGHVGRAREAARLRACCLTDPLTGLRNRRGLEDILRRELERAARERRPLTIAVLDLDGFKQINDRHGHAAGDQILTMVATAITANLRASDSGGRLGGDEFLLVLPGTSLDAAAPVLARVRRAITSVTVPGVARAVSVSIGAATLSPRSSPRGSPGRIAAHALALIGRADRAMYQDKNARNASAASRLYRA